MDGSIHILCEASVSSECKRLPLLMMIQCIATVCFPRKLLFLFPALPISNLNPNERVSARRDLGDETISLSLGSYPNLNQSTTHRGTNFNVRIDINCSARFCYWKNTQQALATEMSITKDIFSEPYGWTQYQQETHILFPGNSWKSRGGRKGVSDSGFKGAANTWTNRDVAHRIRASQHQSVPSTVRKAMS